MRTHPTDAAPRAAQAPQAAAFIDFENLYRALHARHADADEAEEALTEILHGLKRFLAEELPGGGPARAYADFNDLAEHGAFLQRALFDLGFEPRYVSAEHQAAAAAEQLCIEAAALSAGPHPPGAFVIVTGDRLYVPLQAWLRQCGRRVVTFSAAPRRVAAAAPFLDTRDALDLGALVGKGGRSAPARPPAAGDGSAEKPPAAPRRLEDPAARRALEIIEEHFGQYDEVFLTPLLRKFSDEFDDACDPKAIVALLEEAGAAWLEKREGFPYAYTVLLVDAAHPDVQAVRAAYGRADALPSDFTL